MYVIVASNMYVIVASSMYVIMNCVNQILLQNQYSHPAIVTAVWPDPRFRWREGTNVLNNTHD